MRLKLLLGCDSNTVLPYNYNYQLYMAITWAIHRTKTTTPSRGFSLFTFSQLYFESYNVSAQGIVNLGKNISWYISSPKHYFLEGLLKGLKSAGCLNLGNIAMPIKDIEVRTTPDIGDEMEFSCMSPITVANCQELNGQRPRYGRLEDHDFSERLRQDVINKYYRIYDALPADETLTFEFNKRYRENKRRVSRLIDFNGIKIMGYMLPFTVRGNPELIRIGYQVGFGNRNNCGFGMVKIWYPQTAAGIQEDSVVG